ncbi:teneurin-2 isoform X2 [Silurus asotus]|uniref:Teneurin-2 isoform X2 n=1 Tax=Silurus asotus TaxID=30991 RepID=A0AAD5FNH8_SILAS|nr:teneurin-2 isoform X2 [Silurus asotus]
MDTKEKRQRSLARARCRKEPHYSTSSMAADERHASLQKRYSSSETLTAYEQEAQIHYGPRAEEYIRQGSLTLADLGVCEPQQQSMYCSDLGLVQQGYTLSAAYDADSDPEGLVTSECAVQLWRGQGLKSHHSSGLSSPDQSALTLTDSENEHKTDDESGSSSCSGFTQAKAAVVRLITCTSADSDDFPDVRAALLCSAPPGAIDLASRIADNLGEVFWEREEERGRTRVWLRNLISPGSILALIARHVPPNGVSLMSERRDQCADESGMAFSVRGYT